MAALLELLTRAAIVIRESEGADEHAALLAELDAAALDVAGCFTYHGSVNFRNRSTGEVERLEHTTITITAPNAAAADAIVRRYGLDSVRRAR